MSDLLERLRKPTVSVARVIWPQECDFIDIERREAADEIARLTAEVERLRKVHEAELGVCEQHCDVVMRLQAVVDAARELLEQTCIAEGFCMPYPSQQKLHDALRALDGEP